MQFRHRVRVSDENERPAHSCPSQPQIISLPRNAPSQLLACLLDNEAQLRGMITASFLVVLWVNDPNFEKKAADVIGLYLKPPANALVFCVDETTAIQALDRLDPVLPLSPGRAERHGFEYFRHGTLSLYAALNTQTGEVTGKTANRHTSAEFVAFLSEVCSQQPKEREIHVIADNLSAHKTA